MKTTSAIRTITALWLLLGTTLTYAGVTITPPQQTPAGALLSSGVGVTIDAAIELSDGSSIDSVGLIISHDDGLRQWSFTNAMTFVSASDTTFSYSGAIPPLNAGSVSYAVVCHYDDGEVATSTSGGYTIADVPGVETGRYMDFEAAWTSIVASNYFFSVDAGDWTAQGVSFANLGAGRPDGGVLKFGQLLNIYGSYFQSPPIVGGVGTIYYSARPRNANQTQQILIQVSCNDTPTEWEWETVKILNFPNVNPQANLAEPVVLNRFDVRRIRFFFNEESPYDSSTARTFGAVAFDHIVISYPPADVAINDSLRNPGYPAQDQEIRMRCQISDLNPAALTLNQRVTLYYQWVLREADRPRGGSWLAVNMADQGAGRYEGVIPEQRPGYVYYYYKCDFDGYAYSRDPDGAPGTPAGRPCIEPLHTEDNSPRYWERQDGVESTVGHVPNFYGKFEVRRYRSEYGRVWLDAEPATASVAMELVGDETWQGITLVTGLPEVKWYFTGFNRYTDDATEFSQVPVIWGDNDQGVTNAPLGGFVNVGATNRIVVGELDYNGFLLMRFNTVEEDYIVKRAVYQNFDQWLASKEYFESSLGLFATKSYPETFNEWPRDGYSEVESPADTFDNDTPGDDFGQLNTVFGWRVTQGRVINERKQRRDDPINRALVLARTLSGGFGGGRLRNSGDSLTGTLEGWGLERLTCQLRAGINDRNYALYTGGFGWAQGQEITVKFAAEELSPGVPYISVLANFVPSYTEEPSFYEIRFSQVDETAGNVIDNRISLQLFRWINGVPSLPLATWGDGGKLLVEKTLTITISGASPVNINVKVDGNATARINYNDSTVDRLASGGSVAFLTHDAVPLFNTLLVKSTDSGATLYGKGSGFTDVVGWYMGGKRADTGTDRWTRNGTAITRQVPTQKVSVWTAPRRQGADGPSEHDLVKLSEVNVNTLNYTALNVPIKLWDHNFVELRHESGDADVVIDTPRIYPWRANSRGGDGVSASFSGVNCRTWSGKDQQYEWYKNELGWAVLEGMVTNAIGVGVGGRDVHFERSRANPALDIALLSPVLTNGIGEIEFFASVSGGEAHYAVERTDEGVMRNWATIATFTNNAGDSMVQRNVPIRENYMGRIRIRLLPSSDLYARLMIDDVTARDYPPRDDTTWQAYNVLITDQQTNRLYMGQTCFINNSIDKDTQGIVDEHQPYVQTPAIGTGIGEVAFYFRSWSGTTPTVLTIKKAPDAETPDKDWITVTNITVQPGTDYVYFNDQTIYDRNNHVVRFYGDTNGTDRIAIDNIMVAEPVRPSFEIQAVRLVPGQPLSTGPTAVEADIGRFLMNPKGVKLYLSYQSGTNTWGVNNWWSPNPANDIELEQVAPNSRTYRTPENRLLPALPIDAVMQYYVWGTHDEIHESEDQIEMGVEAFAHPTWYYPIDLNTTFAAQGWAPYYFSYSCPPASVWINEVNSHLDSFDGTIGDFVELLGPAGANIGGWRIEIMNFALPAVMIDHCVINPGKTLPNNIKGWGFFVWGDANVANVDQVFSTTKYKNVPQNGGLRLVRSNGAWEERLCFGTSAKSNLEQQGYYYIGMDDGWDPVSLALRTSVAEATTYDQFYWPSAPSDVITPGAPNQGQGLGDITAPVGYFTFISTITINGLQGGAATQLVTEEVATGSAFELLYAANPWYRIGAFKSNGVDVSEALGATSFNWEVAAMSGDVSNDVAFVAVDTVATYGVSAPLGWLSQWSEAEIAAAVASGDEDDLSVDDEYLLNTDPTADTTAALRVTAIEFVGSDLHVTVRLERDTVVSGYNSGHINGVLVLEARPSLGSGEFQELAGTVIDGAAFSDGAGGDEHTYIFEDVQDAAHFYRAVIRPADAD